MVGDWDSVLSPMIVTAEVSVPVRAPVELSTTGLAVELDIPPIGLVIVKYSCDVGITPVVSSLVSS